MNELLILENLILFHSMHKDWHFIIFYLLKLVDLFFPFLRKLYEAAKAILWLSQVREAAYSVRLFVETWKGFLPL